MLLKKKLRFLCNFREPRTPSPAGTVIPTATTWMTGSQPVQLIRATSAINIGHSPRANIAQSTRTKIESNICFSHTFRTKYDTFLSIENEFINKKISCIAFTS